jgi:hypothetical protein
MWKSKGCLHSDEIRIGIESIDPFSTGDEVVRKLKCFRAEKPTKLEGWLHGSIQVSLGGMIFSTLSHRGANQAN